MEYTFLEHAGDLAKRLIEAFSHDEPIVEVPVVDSKGSPTTIRFVLQGCLLAKGIFTGTTSDDKTVSVYTLGMGDYVIVGD